MRLREIEGTEAPCQQRNLHAVSREDRSTLDGPIVTTKARKKAGKKKGGLTPDGRRKLAEAMRKRWAAAKAEGPPNKPRSKRAAKKAA